MHTPLRAALPVPEELAAAAAAGDLIVGFPNANEVREINDLLEVEGNVIVVNNGTLKINGVALRVTGNIVLMNSARLEVHGGPLAMEQDFPYQRAITIVNKASLWLDNAILSCGGYNLNVAVSDTAVWRLDGTTTTAGITTTVLDKYASIEADGSQQLGEFLYFDHARGSFSNCTGMLTWLTLPASSTLETALPGSQVTGTYAFPDSAVAAAGFDYHVQWDGCFGLLWGLMLEGGCTATIRDSDILAVGAMFRGSGSANVTGLVNNATLQQSRYPADDREVRFERCTVAVWNFYSFDNVQLTIANSIFGEVIAFGRSDATVQSSLCDGSGGYIAAFDDATMLILQSQITARIIARNRGQIIVLASTVNTHIPHAADNGVIALFHSSFPSLPTIEAGSVATVISVDEPRRAEVDARVPVYGTVRFLAGADVPVHFVSFWMTAANTNNPDLVLWQSPPSIIQRYRDTLGVWDTNDFLPGDYELTVHMRLSNDDTIRIPALVQLTEATVGVDSEPSPATFAIRALYPQPARGGETVTVRFSDADAGGTLLLCDVLGREVRRMDFTGGMVRIETAGLAPGTYLLSAVQAGALRGSPLGHTLFQVHR
ncbi:MAG: hypothetical protein IH600_17670 [Bacteroidetes bacterium]|nr:hypothetical protein [Bacteroidota bacterium]